MNQFKRRDFISLSKKLIIFLFLCLIILIGNGFGQIIINNPKKPKSNRAGRTVILEEVMRIRDDGINSTFRNPRYLSLLKDGSLVFFDYPNIYRYDKNGKFIFKILKQGKGPQECQHPDKYILDENKIRVYSWVPPKILEYDLNGRYLREEKTPYHGPFVYLNKINDKIYGIRDEIRFSEFIHKEGFFETPYTLYEISKDFKKLKKIYEIPVKHYIKKARWWRRFIFAIVPFKHFLFIVHTSEYKIVKFNLQSRKVERIFKRQYSRIKSNEKETQQDYYEKVPRRLLPPRMEYVFDILWIQVFKNTLWVFTSTNKNNWEKILIDVFDMKGNYLDCFYLQFPENNERYWAFNSLVSDNGFIFLVSENKDTELISIGKYRIKNYNP
jgi:hypothetical protein